MSIYDSIFQYIPFDQIEINHFLINLGLAVLLILIGVVIGKVFNYILKKIAKKIEIEKHVQASFVDLAFVVLRWSIYVLFINFALKQIGIGAITNFFSNILLLFPAFTGALILVGVGFAIAAYLRGVIEDAEVDGWKILSQFVFYFVLFIFGIYALRTALISLDVAAANYILVTVSTVVASGITYHFARK